MKKNFLKYLMILFMVPLFTSCGYNKLVNLDENTDSAWANVEDAYKRRADLVSQLVKVVKGSADFERTTLTEVIEARAKATSVNIDPKNATAEQMQEFMKAQDGLGGALGRLLVSVERYPELKSTAAFRDLQAQIEGTENRISVARQRFNEAIKGYNSYRRGFPQVIYSKMMGFGDKEYFKGSEKDKEAPQIDFDFSKEKEAAE